MDKDVSIADLDYRAEISGPVLVVPKSAMMSPGQPPSAPPKDEPEVTPPTASHIPPQAIIAETLEP